MKEIFEKIESIRVSKKNGLLKPHKFALFLAIARSYELEPYRDGCFTVSELDPLFSEAFKKLANSFCDRTNLIEYPFYHLQTDGIWKIISKEGKEIEFRRIQDSYSQDFVRKRFTKKKATKAG